MGLKAVSTSVINSGGGGVIPVTGLVPNDQTAAAANRNIINAAIIAANASVNGGQGATVLLPKGLYYVSGTGTASDGAIQILSYVTLAGQGMGVTIIKLADNQAAEVTGIIRTPSGEVTTFFGLRDLTIDGNDANNAQVVKGFYCGVSPSHRCTVSVSGTTGTVTTYNDAGTATRSNGLATNDVIFLTNGLVQGLNGDFTYTRLTSTTGTIPVVSGTSSDLVGYTWYYDDPFASIADTNFIIENVEIQYCQDYGFDPHERCSQFVFRNCYAHDNGTSSDGFTFDGCWDGLVENCYSWSNGRNGFNIITGSGRIKFVGCEAWLNGQYGFASQRGSTTNGGGTIQENTDISFAECLSYSNTQYGFRIIMSEKTKIMNCNSFLNGRDGIRFEGSVGCEAVGNQVHSNGQTTTNTYPEIYLLQYALSIYNIGTAGTDVITYGSTYNIIGSNVIDSPLIKKANYSGLEATDASNYNSWSNNKIITSGATGGISVPAANTGSTPGTMVTIIDNFAATGTWNKRANLLYATVSMIGSGGGGGGGARVVLTGVPSGGGGGGAGGYTEGTLLAASLGTTETVTINAAGTGGNGATADGNPGSDGSAGGTVTFGAHLTAFGGGFGSGGAVAGDSGGGGGAGAQSVGGNASGGTGGSAGTAGGATGGSGSSSGSTNTSSVGAAGGGGGATTAAGSGGGTSLLGAGGGGGGGGLTAGGTFRAGGAGGRTRGFYTAPAGGATAGLPGTSPAVSEYVSGAGAGGGASNPAGVGGAGGTGGSYGGGGGGGGAATGGNGGRGGDGGPGYCRVINYISQ